MALRKTFGDAEAEARSLADPFGGEKRGHQPGLNIRGNSRTAIHDLDRDFVAQVLEMQRRNRC